MLKAHSCKKTPPKSTFSRILGKLMFRVEDNDFNTIYTEIVKHVLNNGNDITVRNKRTKECTECFISLTNISNHRLIFSDTNAYERQEKYDKYCSDEISWYESGCLIAKHAPSRFWETIADNEGKIQSNYGHIILHAKRPYTAQGTTSFENAIRLLNEDKFSRQVILHYNLPSNYNTATKDIPCTISTQVLIRGNKLSFLVSQRSSDLYRGLPYDLAWHCHLMNKFIKNLSSTYTDITAGALSMMFGSIHIYSEYESFFQKFLEKRINNDSN